MKLHWYRIEIGAGGKAKCTQVEEASESESLAVYYRRAASAAKAIDLARKAYNLYHSTQLAARRAKYAEEGRCRCGRLRDKESPADRAFMTCPACRALHPAQHQRAEARRKGLPAPPPALTKAEHFVSRRNEEKLAVLHEVHDRFLRMTMSQFGTWIKGEIAKLETAPAAAEKPKLAVVR